MYCILPITVSRQRQWGFQPPKQEPPYIVADRASLAFSACCRASIFPIVAFLCFEELKQKVPMD